MGKRVNFSSIFAPNKHARKKLRRDDDDRISQLPEDILVSVLSLLPLKEAVRTSVLSKRWMNLWTSTSHLDFFDPKALERIRQKCEDKPYLEEESRKYVDWVNKVLEQHIGRRLDLFDIIFNLNESHAEHIDKWLEFAFAMNVQKLKLHLLSSYGGHRPSGAYVFPDTSVLGSWRANGFKFLKELSLKCVNVTGDVVRFFLHNCPSLERMVVYASRALVSLEVSGLSLPLKHLEFWFCFNLESLVLRDTNLVSLTVINSSAAALHLERMPSLLDVRFGIWEGSPRICHDDFAWLSCCFSQLVCFRLFITEDYLESMKRYKFPELTKLKQLLLVIQLYDGESIRGCMSLIKAAPNMQRLVVMVRNYVFYDKATAKLAKIDIDPCRPEFSHVSSNQPQKRRIGRLIRRLHRAVPPHIEFVIV